MASICFELFLFRVKKANLLYYNTILFY